MISADMFLRKPCCSDSESELSNSAKSSVPIGDVVSKRVATLAVSTGSAVKSKLKPNPRVMNVVSNSECSGYDSSVVDWCSVVKGVKLKRSKRVAVSVHDQPEVQLSKSKPVSSNVAKR